jgi:hypothetical protein
MEDIRRWDRQLLLRELVKPFRVILTLGGLLMAFGALVGESFPAFLFVASLILLLAYGTARNSARAKRFRHRRMEALWNGCQERLERFEETLKRMRKDQIADLREMPKTVRSVGEALYAALRRADVVSSEIQESERGLYAQPPVWAASTTDPQSKELYRVADKNIAEYRSQFAGVMAGVQRTEAQSAVFMTTVDNLRMKILGYRLVGRRPEMDSHEFLAVLAEARAQLQAIDHALEELDLGHYPKNIAVVPPPHPTEPPLEQRLSE